MDVFLGVVLVLLQIPDVVSTNLVLREGGRELNPLMRLCMRMGRLWWVPKLAVATTCVVVILAEGGDGWTTATLALLDVLYVAVVASNLRQLRILRRRRARTRSQAG